MTRNKFLQIRISPQEKRELNSQAQFFGFHSMSAYMLYAVRAFAAANKYKENNDKKREWRYVG